MSSIVALDQAQQGALKFDFDALVRQGARRLLLPALKAEVDESIAQPADHRAEAGHALVVRNGVSEPWKVTTAAGELESQTPRVHDRRDGQVCGVSFAVHLDHSRILKDGYLTGSLANKRCVRLTVNG